MKDLIKILLITLVFMLGWTSSYVYSGTSLENPSSFVSDELISPQSRISEDDVYIFGDHILIEISDASGAIYADTNSMDPVLDDGAIGLEIVPSSEDSIHIGDIVSFRTYWSNSLIVHRVIMIGEDDQGWYCITKGDNSAFTDPGKLRFEDIEYVLIGVLY